jgi:transposase-like protein
MPLVCLTEAERRELQRTARTTRDARVLRRAQALLDLDRGESVEQVVQRYQVSRSTVYNWVARSRELGPSEDPARSTSGVRPEAGLRRGGARERFAVSGSRAPRRFGTGVGPVQSRADRGRAAAAERSRRRRGEMRAILLPALTLSAAASVALAEPVKPTAPTPPPAGSRSEATAPPPLASDGEPEPPQPTAPQIDAVTRAPLISFGAEAGPSRVTDRRATGGGPVRLSATQMDAITAGLVAVDVTAFAAAQGSDAYTGTDTRTDAAGSEWIEVAYGTGEAYAVGDGAAADAATSVYGEGDYVVSGDFRSVVNGPGSAQGRTMGFVIVIDADHPRFEVLRRRFERLTNHLERGYEVRASRIQHVSERLAARGDRGDERLAGYLGRGYERLVGFVERGYAHFVRVADRELGRPAGQLERRSGE